jgi:methyl-accepting chemotaxis protein
MRTRLRRFSSLSTRLVVAVLATASVAFILSVSLTIWRLNLGLERQAAQLARLSEEKLGERLDGDARLAGARVQTLFADAGVRLESIAQRADVVKAVSTRNSITISDLLGRAARSADLDGIVVVDSKLAVIGADREALNAGQPPNIEVIDILATSQALSAHPFSELMRPLLAENDRKRPTTLRRVVKLTDDLAKAVGSKNSAPLAVVAVEPIFDDFGDVFAALVGYRSLRKSEPTLEEFSKLEGAAVAVFDAERLISLAGSDAWSMRLAAAPGSTLLRTTDDRYWARCADLFESSRICSLAPTSELYTLRDELVRIGEMEGRSLTVWLSIFAIFSLALFAATTLLTARRISRPLARITEAVIAVARGDWKSEVSGAERQDEVGDIARAVVVLQRSLEERDRLRSDVLSAETVKKRREALEDAIRRFDRLMRSMLLSVSDSVEMMDDTARELARMSSVAEGEAAEAAFVSENTVSNVSTVRSATERLSASIADTAERLRDTANAITAASSVAQSASLAAEGLASTTNDFDDVVRMVEDIAAQINAVALNATIQASRAADGGANFGAVVSDIRGLGDRITKANGDVAGRMSYMRGANVEAAEALRTIVQRLNLLVRQTMTVALAMEQQDAVTRQIVDGMTAAANGSVNVSTSVGRLKATIEEAREASMKVVTKAADMADEAHRLDSTVKSFLREVTA